jgi:hypothetical protein
MIPFSTNQFSLDCSFNYVLLQLDSGVGSSYICPCSRHGTRPGKQAQAILLPGSAHSPGLHFQEVREVNTESRVPFYGRGRVNNTSEGVGFTFSQVHFLGGCIICRVPYSEGGGGATHPPGFHILHCYPFSSQLVLNLTLALSWV